MIGMRSCCNRLPAAMTANPPLLCERERKKRGKIAHTHNTQWRDLKNYVRNVLCLKLGGGDGY